MRPENTPTQAEAIRVCDDMQGVGEAIYPVIPNEAPEVRECTSGADEGDRRSGVRRAVEEASEFHSSISEEQVDAGRMPDLVDASGICWQDLGILAVMGAQLDHPDEPGAGTHELRQKSRECFSLAMGLLYEAFKFHAELVGKATDACGREWADATTSLHDFFGETRSPF